MKHKVSITTDGIGHGTVTLDGYDLSTAVRGVQFRGGVGGVGEVDELTLDLSVIEAERLDSAEAEVIIPESTREALVKLGWTPPEDVDA